MYSQAICRVMEMEYRFDLLLSHTPEQIRQDPNLQQYHRDLIVYYDNGAWLSDYTLDEADAFPCWLKRGVLSQDGLYDLLCRLSSMQTTP